jgi:hypothetical protein
MKRATRKIVWSNILELFHLLVILFCVFFSILASTLERICFFYVFLQSYHPHLSLLIRPIVFQQAIRFNHHRYFHILKIIEWLELSKTSQNYHPLY